MRDHTAPQTDRASAGTSRSGYAATADGASAGEATLLMAISEELAALEGGSALGHHGEARRLLEEAFARVERAECGRRDAA